MIRQLEFPIIFLTFGLLFARGATNATSGASPASRSVMSSVPATNIITFTEFLDEVARANLDYAAQRYNVSIAQAAIAAAREFSNPKLDLSADSDISSLRTSERQASHYGAALTQTIETGGKRGARQLIARQNHAAAAATLESFLNNLKLDAAAAFAEAIALSRTADQKRQSAEFLANLVRAQRERLRVGDVGQVDVLQTQVEEQQFQTEVLAAESEAANAALALNSFVGRDREQTRFIPRGNLDLPGRDFDLSKLVGEALQNRGDLVALRRTRDSAQSGVRLAKVNRVPDVDVGLGWTRATKSEATLDPTPEFDTLGLTVSLPLPLWNRNKAAIATARFTAEQAQKQLESAELKAEVQLRQAFTAYRSAVERLNHYRGTILKDADAVLEAKRFSYQRGQATLLELLEAQRKANEVHAGYNDSLADHAKALIELERAAGLWDVEF